MISNQCLERLVHWLIYGVIITAIPLIFKYIWLLLKQVDPKLVHIISNGELIIISVSLLAASIGEVAAWEPPKKLLKKIVLGFELVLCMLCCMTFALVTNNANINMSNQQALAGVQLELSKSASILEKSSLQSMEVVVTLSVVFFVCALLTSVCGIILSERDL